MTVWVLHCWARDLPNGGVLSWHPTLEDAIDATLAWIEGDRMVVPSLGSVYSIAEARNELRPQRQPHA